MSLNLLKLIYISVLSCQDTTNINWSTEYHYWFYRIVLIMDVFRSRVRANFAIIICTLNLNIVNYDENLLKFF